MHHTDGARYYCSVSQRGTSGNAGDESGDSGSDCLDRLSDFAIWKQAERTARDAKTGAEIVFHIGDEGIRARQANGKGEISWDKLVKVKKIAGIYVLYLGRDKAYLMPKRVFRGSEEQIFLSMLTRNLPQEKRRGIRA